jgi:hypothetical protein
LNSFGFFGMLETPSSLGSTRNGSQPEPISHQT